LIGQATQVTGTLTSVYVVGVTGTFTLTAASQSLLRLLDPLRKVAAPSWLQTLTDNGFLAIGVPNLPVSNVSGTIASSSVQINYDDIGRKTNILEVRRLARRSAYEPKVNADFPMLDGQSHWETWWLSKDQSFPAPSGAFTNLQFRTTIFYNYPGNIYGPC